MLATFAIGASGIENQSGPQNSMTHGPPSEDANMHKIELLSFKMLHYTVVQKIPDPCYICKYLQQILVNISNFWYRESTKTLQCLHL